MSEKLLQQILSELKDLKTEVSGIKTQLNENTQMTRAIFDRQEETDARPESMSMDFHKMHGDITSLKENVTTLQDEFADKKDELAFISHKVYRNEAEIFKLRRGHTL